MCRARLQRLPGVLVYRRHTDVDGAAGRFGQVRQHVAIAHHHRAFGDQAGRIPCAHQRLQRFARQLVMAFDRLVTVGRGADCDVLAGPRGPRQFTFEHLDEVLLYQNHRREFVVGVHLELAVIAPRIAIMATVRAAAIGVERPVERHSFHAVERRTAGHFLIGRLIGASFCFGERFGAAALYGIRDIADGRLRSTRFEVEE